MSPRIGVCWAEPVGGGLVVEAEASGNVVLCLTRGGVVVHQVTITDIDRLIDTLAVAKLRASLINEGEQ